MKVREEFGKKIAKLIDVKSLMTIALTGVVCYLAIIGKFDIKDIYLMIVGFYFGTQIEKKNNKNKEEK